MAGKGEKVGESKMTAENRGGEVKDGKKTRSNVVKITTITDREEWDKFVTERPEANFLQSWDFYEFYRSRGNAVVRRAAVDAKGRILAVYAGVVETAKRGTYLAIAGGPIGDFGTDLRSFEAKDEEAESATETEGEKKKIETSKKAKNGSKIDEKLVEAIFEDMREQGRKYHCAFVRVRPQWERNAESLALMQKLGLKPAPMYLSVEYAGILDLNKTEEEILKGASQGFRRKLRKAAKEDLQLSADDKEESIREFCALEKKHAERQKYVAFSGDFLRKQFEAFKKNGEVLIYTARRPDGEILAQNFMIFYGPEASYHYGVSSEAGTRISAAPLLHLKAMEEARKRGCVQYNLWGIVEKDEKEHRFYGVSEFKRSFGCQEFKYVPAHDMVLEPLKYQVTKLIETVRKKKRHV